MWSTIMFGTEAPNLFLEWSYSGMSPLVGATLRLNLASPTTDVMWEK